MRYLTVRCDGPGCMREASRLFAALPASASMPTGPDAYATPGRWHILSFQGLEDLHFCGYPCLERWAASQQLPKGTVGTLADVLPLESDIAEQPTAVFPVQAAAAAAAAGTAGG